MDDLPVVTFPDGDALRRWLEVHHADSPGVWVRIFKRDSGVPTVTFNEVLEQGLCFGWSESKRIRGDEASYLQRFTPRRSKGTASKRNKALALRLIAEGRMTESGIEALAMIRPGGPHPDETLVSPRSVGAEGSGRSP
jgi:uncharacterized protein YdeI (YjbR/CyaY-like superfamily)